MASYHYKHTLHTYFVFVLTPVEAGLNLLSFRVSRRHKIKERNPAVWERIADPEGKRKRRKSSTEQSTAADNSSRTLRFGLLRFSVVTSLTCEGDCSIEVLCCVPELFWYTWLVLNHNYMRGLFFSPVCLSVCLCLSVYWLVWSGIVVGVIIVVITKLILFAIEYYYTHVRDDAFYIPNIYVRGIYYENSQQDGTSSGMAGTVSARVSKTLTSRTYVCMCQLGRRAQGNFSFFPTCLPSYPHNQVLGDLIHSALSAIPLSSHPFLHRLNYVSN